MRDKILLLVGLVLIVLCTLCFFYFYESYEIERKVGYSIKAQRNSLLAAEQFLEKVGIEVDSSIDYLYVDQVPTDTTIFLTKVDSMLLTPKQIDAAIEWLQNGGKMVVGVGRETSSADSLLQRFDVTAQLYADIDDVELDITSEKLSDQLRKQNQRLKDKQQETSESDANDTESPDHNIVNVHFSDSDQPLTVEFVQDIQLSHPDISDDDFTDKSYLDYKVSSWTENDHGIKLIQFDIGEGLLTVLSGAELWDNGYIDNVDNAHFLAELMSGQEKVNFYVNVNATPLSALLTTNFPQMILFLIAGLFLWLWREFVRISSVEEHIIGDRRALSEHLMASSELLSKNNRYDLLVQPLINDIEKSMAAYKHQFHDLESHEKITLIAQHSKLKESVIEEWFQQLNNVNDSITFLNAVKTGKLIRNRL